MQYRILKLVAAPWTPFGSKDLQGPIGLTKSITISTEFGLRKHDIYVGSTSASDAESQPLLIVELNFLLFAEQTDGWAALEISCGKGTMTAIPVEVKQSEVAAFLFSNGAEHVREAALFFAKDCDLELVIHGPSGPIAEFSLPADGHSFRLLSGGE